MRKTFRRGTDNMRHRRRGISLTRALVVLAAVLSAAAVAALSGAAATLGLHIDGWRAPVRALAQALDTTTSTDTSSSTPVSSSTSTPSDSTSTPSDSTSTPSDSTSTPSDSTSTPGGSTSTPGGSTILPSAVAPGPVAAISAPTDASANASVSFDGSGSSDSGGTLSSWTWDFGDGEGGTGPQTTHTYTTGGFYTVTLTVSDGTNESTTSVGVNVFDAQDDSYTTQENQALSAGGETSLFANDSKPPNSQFAATIVTPPAHGQLAVNGAGGFTYTPTTNYVGDDTFQYSLTDGDWSSAPATVTIHVTTTDQAPAANADEYSTTAGSPLTVDAPGVLGNDTDADGDSLTAAIDQQPANGQLTLDADGSFTYTPADGFVGDDTFTYTASDGTLASDPATVTIHVRPANDDLANATRLDGANGSVSGTNVDATHEDGEPQNPSATSSSQSSVWYVWTAPASALATASTGSSDYAIGVYGLTGGAAPSFSSLTLLSNSAQPGGVTFQAIQGVTYYISIDGEDGETGSFTLAWSSEAGIPAPANDDLSGAQSISPDSGNTYGTTVGATAEEGEPNAHGASVWYVWTPSQTGTASFTAAAYDSFSPTLAAYSAPSADATFSHLTQLATGAASEGSATAQITFSVTAGDTYFVQVDSADSGTGGFTLSWTNQTVQYPPSGAVADLSGCTATSLGPNDDGSAQSALQLPFAINFFGVTYTQIWVNNNGNVTLGNAADPAQPLSSYTPSPIVANGLPIIAPYWADVDTEGDGSGVVSYGTTTYQGHPAVCVLWPHVGYYPSATDKLNTFQLLLVDRSDTNPRGTPSSAGDNFDIIFNYDNVRWESGEASGGNDGVCTYDGCTSARAGYSNGTSAASLELPGSAVHGAFLDSNPSGLIHSDQNSGGQLGRYVFPVRSGQAPTGHAISGHVYDGSNEGAGLGGASITICSAGGCVTTTSHDDGSYSYGGLTPGTYVVRATPPSGSSLRAIAKQVTLGSDSDLTGVDLTLPSAAPDLRISVSISPTTPIVGQATTITYQVQNAGNADATNVAFSATIPTNSHFGHVTVTTSSPPPRLRVLAAADPASCTPDTQTQNVVCSLGTIASGGSDTVAMTVMPTQRGTISSTGSGGSLETAADPETGSATVDPASTPPPPPSNSGGSTTTSGTTTTTTTTATTPTITGPPPPPPPPPAGNAAVQPVSGTVLVNGQPLSDLQTIPVGATIDATNGIVQITTIGANGQGQTAYFFGGVFQIQQVTSNGSTILKLQGGDFDVCTAPKAKTAHRARHLDALLAKGPKGKSPKASKGKKSTKVIRSLWGEGKGNFRTQGKYASATVRGTFWLTADRCDGTLVKVNTGLVGVLNLVTHKTIVLHAGQSYLAPAP